MAGVCFVDPAGSDANSGSSPSSAKRTIQAAYDDLVASAETRFPSFPLEMGVGRIYLLPGDHDVGTGLVIRWDRPVEMFGFRGGEGKSWTRTPGMPARIVSSSSDATALVTAGSVEQISYGNRFEDILFAVDPAVNTSLTACLRAIANDFLIVEHCGFDMARGPDDPTQNFHAIHAQPGTMAQKDAAWHRITHNNCNRLALYHAGDGAGSTRGNFNRSEISSNIVFYKGDRPMIWLEDDWMQGTVAFNNLEGPAIAVQCDSTVADHNLFLQNGGESPNSTHPYYVINGGHQGSMFIGGQCFAQDGGVGTWIAFGSSTWGNIVMNGEASLSGKPGFKYLVSDPSGKNVLMNHAGIRPRVKVNATSQSLADYDFELVPDDGAWGFTYNTAEQRAYLNFRANGTWKKVALA